jgi:hypothetical protein
MESVLIRIFVVAIGISILYHLGDLVLRTNWRDVFAAFWHFSIRVFIGSVVAIIGLIVAYYVYTFVSDFVVP